MDAHLKVEVVEPDGDAEAVDELVRNLRLELLDLDVESVAAVPAGPAPPGSKGVELAAAAALIVQLKASVAAVSAVVSAVRAWLLRGKQPPGIGLKITIGERTLELSAATPEQQEQLVQEFLRSLPPTDE